VLIPRSQSHRGREYEIVKNLDSLLELAKGGDAGEGGKQILSDILLLPMRCWEDPLFAFALYEPQAKTITVKLVT
jgi:hypothetical protein